MQSPVIQALLLFVPLMFIVCSIAYLGLLFTKREERVKKVWSDIAKDMGLVFDTSGGGSVASLDENLSESSTYMATIEKEIRGDLPGGKLRLCWVHNHNDTVNSSLYGRVSFEVPFDLGMSITTKGVFSTGPDLKTGDTLFDETFTLRARDETAALKMLSLPVRKALLQVKGSVRTLQVTDTGLQIKSFTRPNDTKSLRRVIEEVVGANTSLQDAFRALSIRELGGEADALRTLPEFREDDADVFQPEEVSATST